MSRVVLVAGTFSWNGSDRGDWYAPGSPFAVFLASRGVEPLFGVRPDGPHPFTWSTELGGIGGRGRVVWQAAGVNLFNYLVPPLCPDRQLPSAETNLIAHSHGLQVVLFAAAAGLNINTLISVGSPVRRDMWATAVTARLNIRHWLHIHSDQSDRWQWLGELFDGHLGIVREHPLADQNDFVPVVGHSELLRNPEHFHHWSDRGWLRNFEPERRAA